VADNERKRLEERKEQSIREELQTIVGSGDAGELADAQHSQRRTEHEEHSEAYGWNGSRGSSELSSMEQPSGEQMGIPRFSWLGREADWIDCRDNKRRPVEPGTFPLAHGVSNRVGMLRGYGNAIVAPLAKEFIKAYLETRP